MLRIEHISVAYGKHEALHDITLDIDAGRTTVILGANGAGKTTLLKTIAGLVRPRPGGRILFQGRPIEAEPPHRIVAAGIVLVPEGRRLFGEMTVLENLRMGAYTGHARKNEAIALEKQFALFPRLAERRDQLAKTMSGGEQQMLAISRGLMSEPKILLLDEPSLGLAPRLIRELFSALRTITKGGQSVVLVEQNVHQSLRLADRVYVLENGRIHSSGAPADIQQDTVIRQAYLGLKPPDVAAAKASDYEHPGGFVNPFARTVPTGAASGKQRAMTTRMEGFNAMGGFYNPYARSVGSQAPTVPEQGAPAVESPAAPAERVSEGGFSNPFARSVAPKQ